MELWFDDWHNDEDAQRMALRFLKDKGCTEFWCVWPPHPDASGTMWYRTMGRRVAAQLH